jgi:hypothetical protein
LSVAFCTSLDDTVSGLKGDHISQKISVEPSGESSNVQAAPPGTLDAKQLRSSLIIFTLNAGLGFMRAEEKIKT